MKFQSTNKKYRTEKRAMWITSWKPPMPTTVERQTAQKTGQSFRNGTHRRRGASPPFFSKPSDDSEDFVAVAGLPFLVGWDLVLYGVYCGFAVFLLKAVLEKNVDSSNNQTTASETGPQNGQTTAAGAEPPNDRTTASETEEES